MITSSLLDKMRDLGRQDLFVLVVAADRRRSVELSASWLWCVVTWRAAPWSWCVIS